MFENYTVNLSIIFEQDWQGPGGRGRRRVYIVRTIKKKKKILSLFLFFIF